MAADCFPRSLCLATEIPLEDLKRVYRSFPIGHDPDEVGYHPSIVARAALRWGVTLTPIDMLPEGLEVRVLPGYAPALWAQVVESGWCGVLVGLRVRDQAPHANALVSGEFFDSNGDQLAAPNILVQTLWKVN